MVLSQFLEESNSRFNDDRKHPLFIPAIKDALGFDETTIIGTYDHLRSPFSNRLLSGDERFSRLCSHIGANGILFILDCTMPPAYRCRDTHIGFTMGLSDFLKRGQIEDAVTIAPKTYFPFQPALPLSTMSLAFWDRLYNAIVNLLRRYTKLERKIALRLARNMLSRARALESIYLSAFSEAHAQEENVAKALLRVRKKLRYHCGMDETPQGVRIILYSDIRDKVASALEHFISRVDMSHDFWSTCKQFSYVDSEGYCRGAYKYDSVAEVFVLKSGGNSKLAMRPGDIPGRVAAGTAVPTTNMLYALLHLAGGIPHYGNACGMNTALSRVLAISRPNVDITRDGENSITIGTIGAIVRKRKVVLRNMTADLIWFARSTYRRLVQETVTSGQASFCVDFATDMPDD